jgi:hypothetical protein
MKRVVCGWRTAPPLHGRLAVRLFVPPSRGGRKAGGGAELGEVYGGEDPEGAREAVAKAVRALPGYPVLDFSPQDPLDPRSPLSAEGVAAVLAHLRGYNEISMLHSSYIETAGSDPDAFSELLGKSPDHIGIKFRVPPSEESDHGPVQSAVECLVRSIESTEVIDSERYLIIELDGGSSLPVLGSYFDTISEALSSDDRADYARGAALAAFDIILRPVGGDLADRADRALRARNLLLGAEYGLSQQVLADL